MADTRDAAITAFTGMENSIRSMRYLTLILADMDQNRNVTRHEDGTAALNFDCIDELNAMCFLILQVEEKAQALVKEFDDCIDVWSGDKQAGKEASHG